MIKRIFFLCVILSEIEQFCLCMNTILPLHHLEKKLTQLNQFLLKEKYGNIVKMLLELESQTQAMQTFYQEIDTKFKNLFSLDLKNMQFEFYKPKNDIAHNATKIADSLETLYAKWFHISPKIWQPFKNIGKYFAKNEFTQNEKTKFIAILNKLQDSTIILEKIITYLEKQDLALVRRLKFTTGGYLYDESYVDHLIQKEVIRRFSITSFNIYIIVHRIKELIENNQTLIKDDIEKIKKFQEHIENIYTQSLEIKKTKLNLSKQQIFIESIKNINFSNFEFLVYTMEIYGLFIKDNNLKEELLISLTNLSTFLQTIPDNWVTKEMIPLIHEDTHKIVQNISIKISNLNKIINKVILVLKNQY